MVLDVYQPSPEEQIVDALIKDGNKELAGARLAYVQKEETTGNYELYQYHYRSLDMMYVIYVRKSKTGQYEISNSLPAPEPQPALPMPGGLYEMKQEDIDNDFNIALISQRLNKEYSSVLGRNARIIRVMHQVTNQLIYIITFETADKRQVTYRGVVDQDQTVSVQPEKTTDKASDSTTTTTTITTTITEGGKEGVVDLSSQRASQKVLA